MLIQVASPAQLKALLVCDRLGDVAVNITPHKMLNMVQGLIYHRDLISQSDDELRDNLQHRGVYSGPKDPRVATGAFILAYEGDTLPEKVRVIIFWCDLRRYVPPSMRCFKCWKFGHMSSRCPSSPMCKEYGRPSHLDTP